MSEVVQQILSQHDYEIVKMIGKGGSGYCYLVKSLKFNQEFVCKVTKCANVDPKIIESHKSEAQILSNLNHPNIVRIYDYFIESNIVFQILEYCSGGSLIDLIKSNEKLSSNKKNKIFLEIVDALVFMHQKGIAHCDIKLSNILLDQFGRVKICDFGLSHLISKSKTLKCDKSVRGTMNYMSPEILLGIDYDPFMADVWAVGVTFYTLVTGQFPYGGYSSNTILNEIDAGHTKLDPKYGPMSEIVNWCMKIEPQHRPTMSQLQSKMVELFKPNVEPKAKSTYKVLKSVAQHQLITGKKRLSPSSSGILNIV